MKQVGTLRIGAQGTSVPLTVDERLVIIGPDIEIKKIEGHKTNSGQAFSIPIECRDPESSPE